ARGPDPAQRFGIGKRQVAHPACGVRTMARCEMMRSFAIGLILLGSVILDAAASATGVSSAALDAGINDMPQSPSPPAAPVSASAPAPAPATTVRVVAAPAAPARTPSANP